MKGCCAFRSGLAECMETNGRRVQKTDNGHINRMALYRHLGGLDGLNPTAQDEFLLAGFCQVQQSVYWDAAGAMHEPFVSGGLSLQISRPVLEYHGCCQGIL